MTPQAAERKLLRIADRIGLNCARALDNSARAGVRMGQSLSRGGMSQAALRRAGHPYAVRHGGTAAEAFLINYQRGQFYRGWKAEPPRSAFNGTMKAATINDSPAAGFLAGRVRPKSRMVRRPVDDEVRDRLRPVAISEVREAVRRAVKAR